MVLVVYFTIISYSSFVIFAEIFSFSTSIFHINLSPACISSMSLIRLGIVVFSDFLFLLINIAVDFFSIDIFSLNSVFAVEQLFDEIKKTEDENIILDFSGIQFVALSFAQAYVASKKQCEKNITELNVSDENKITLNIPAQS